MKLASIDIGSNAVRLQITNVIEYQGLITFKKLEYIRFPMRLGHDVFSIGKIGTDKAQKFLRLMRAFSEMIALYDIEHVYACATSAMREASNAGELIETVKKETGLDIHVISGQEEADLINKVIMLYLDDKTYLHIDVGGGSTELNLYVNQHKIMSESFNIGSVRSLEFGDYTQSWRQMLQWIQTYVRAQPGKITAIGTGGNIAKIYELSDPEKNRRISLDMIERVQDYLKKMTQDELINKLQLNPDRADVILPATNIYIEIMKAAKAKFMMVPDVGLKDGINYYLYEKYYPNKGQVIVKNH
jgi:exopolyphosphatase/guanosine-5'-triphosphate,3'-diphosphate pyrophosphatase